MSTACRTRPSASLPSPGGVLKRELIASQGHSEGDLIKGAASASAVGTLVERTSRLLVLIRLPEFKPASAANLMQAFCDKLLGSQPPCAGTWRATRDDAQGARPPHGYRGCFCDPHSPWQRGSSECTHGLVRPYLPKGSDRSGYGGAA